MPAMLATCASPMFESRKRPMFQSFVAKLRPGANDCSRFDGSSMTSVPSPIPEITVKRSAAGKVVAGHDHPSHPEEEDLGRGHQHVGRVECAEVHRLLVWPAERGERPEPAREPGVEHVLVLPHSAAALRAGGDVLATHH